MSKLLLLLLCLVLCSLTINAQLSAKENTAVREIFSAKEEGEVFSAKEEESIESAVKEEKVKDPESSAVKEEAQVFSAKEEEQVFSAKEEEQVFSAKESETKDPEGDKVAYVDAEQVVNAFSHDNRLGYVEQGDITSAKAYAERLPYKNDAFKVDGDKLNFNKNWLKEQGFQSSADADELIDCISAYYKVLQQKDADKLADAGKLGVIDEENVKPLPSGDLKELAAPKQEEEQVANVANLANVQQAHKVYYEQDVFKIPEQCVEFLPLEREAKHNGKSADVRLQIRNQGNATSNVSDNDQRKAVLSPKLYQRQSKYRSSTFQKIDIISEKGINKKKAQARLKRKLTLDFEVDGKNVGDVEKKKIYHTQFPEGTDATVTITAINGVAVESTGSGQRRLLAASSDIDYIVDILASTEDELAQLVDKAESDISDIGSDAESLELDVTITELFASDDACYYLF